MPSPHVPSCRATGRSSWFSSAPRRPAAVLPVLRRAFGRITFSIIAAASGCGDSDDSGPCANPPTFTQDVAPIANAICISCHAPGADRRGAPPDLNFDSWPSIAPVVGEFADAITSGRMPPIGFMPTVAPEDRATVSLWRQCGFTE